MPTTFQRRILLWLILMTLRVSLYGQQYNFVQYGVNQGLEQSYVLSITQSKEGFLLYGTNGGGLGIFDGNKFKAINKKNGLSNNVVFSIAVDSAGWVWAFTNTGISKIDLQNDTVQQVIAVTLPFYASYYDTLHHKLYAADYTSLYLIENDTLRKLSFINFPEDVFIRDITYQYSEEVLWVATQRQGVFKIKNGIAYQFTENNGLSSNYVNKIFISKNNTVYFGTLKGLDVWQQDTVMRVKIIQQNWDIPVVDIVEKNEQLILASLNGLFFHNQKTKETRWIQQKNGLPAIKLWKLYLDNENNLWIATFGKGLLKYQPEFIYFNAKNGLLDEDVYGIYADDSGVYFGAKQGFYRIHTLTNTLTELNNQSIYTYSIDKINDTLFLGTNQGFSFYNTNTKYIVTKYSLDDVYQIKYNDDKIYLSSKNGLYIIKNNVLTLDTLLPQIPYFAFLINEENDIWLSSDNKIIRKKQNRIIEYANGDTLYGQPLTFNRARTVINDKYGNTCVATDVGIYVFTPDTFIRISENQGLKSNNIYLLQKDNAGNIWVGSNKGLNVIYDYSATYKHLKVDFYGYNEGFKGVETNMNAACIDKQNNLWIGTVEGIYKCNLQNISFQKKLPVFVLKKILINDKKYLPATFPLELESSQRNIDLEFVGLYFTNPQQVRYKYKISTDDDHWSKPFYENKLSFKNLAPGDYEIQITASSDGYRWTPPYVVSFTIAPPFWQSKPFYALLLVAIIVIIVLVSHYRTKQLKKKKEELEKLVNERTKELRDEKEKVEEQNKIIRIANKNITDSINYAEKIQASILPDKELLPKDFDDVEVLYLPKDVVSGDFYWFDKVENNIILCAADCTGHGVPGALMSMIGVNNLNQIILENKLIEPDEILFQLNNAVKRALKQEGGHANRDGMDIAVCSVNLDTLQASYAGAFRPLYVVSGNTVTEYKADRKSIGGFTEINDDFTLHRFQLHKGDVLYMYSDGYPDQFGGPKGKKFMNKRLVKLFSEIYTLPIKEQINVLQKTFLQWKGEEEQVDDVLILIAKV